MAANHIDINKVVSQINKGDRNSLTTHYYLLQVKYAGFNSDKVPNIVDCSNGQILISPMRRTLDLGNVPSIHFIPNEE